MNERLSQDLRLNTHDSCLSTLYTLVRIQGCPKRIERKVSLQQSRCAIAGFWRIMAAFGIAALGTTVGSHAPAPRAAERLSPLARQAAHLSGTSSSPVPAEIKSLVERATNAINGRDRAALCNRAARRRLRHQWRRGDDDRHLPVRIVLMSASCGTRANVSCVESRDRARGTERRCT